MAMTERYARALVAIHAVQANETDAITLHKLAEVCAECAWCEREYGEVAK